MNDSYFDENNYEIVKLICNGYFSTVSKIKSKLDGKIYALKIIHISLRMKIEQDQMLKEARQEYEILKYFLKCYASFYNKVKKRFMILMDYHSKNLSQYVDEKYSNHSRIEFQEFLSIYYGLLTGLREMLLRNIVHRDLKPENILLDGSRPIIIDFGVSKIFPSEIELFRTAKIETIAGTPHWMSPEMKNATKPRDFKIDFSKLDMFSVGLICLFILDYEEFKKIKDNFNEDEVFLMSYLKSLKTRGIFPKGFYYILKSMLSFSPASRASATELYEDLDFINTFDKNSKWSFEGSHKDLKAENEELKRYIRELEARNNDLDSLKNAQEKEIDKLREKTKLLEAELLKLKSEKSLSIDGPNVQPIQGRNEKNKLSSSKAFDSIRKFELSNFEIPSDKTLLGKGSFGKVEKIKLNNKNIALKTINDLEEISESPADIANELTIVLLLDHPNLVKGYNYYIDEEKDNLLIMMECHGIDLQTFFEEGEKISNMNIFLSDFFSQTVRGLHFAWEKMQAVHRDLKPSNILYDKTTNIFKIADFGCAKIIRSGKMHSKKKMTGGRGTEIFMAPEQLRNIDSDFYVGDPKRADIFTIGLIILHMILFKDKVKSQLNKANENQSNLLELLRLASKKGLPKFIEFVLPSMLSYNSEIRPDIVELFYMMDVFEKGKPQQIDSILFDKLITLEANKAAIWVKYLAPYLIFGATDSKIAKAGSFYFQILLKSGKFTEKSLGLAFSDKNNKHLPIILSFLLTSKPNQEIMASGDVEKFLELFEKSKISVLNVKSALEILKQAKDKAEIWIRNISPLIIQNETHSNSNLQNYIENLSFIYS